MSALPRDLVFVMPDGSETISGGNRYNAELLAALGPLSRRMAIGDFASQPLEPATYLVDTLNLDCAKAVLARRSEGQRFVLLVHHLPSFEPGLAAEHPSRVLEREVLGRFDGYIATGEFARAWLDEQGFGMRTLLLEPALAVGDVGSRECSQSVSALMVCNLIPRKGVLAFLQRLAERLARQPTHETFALMVLGRHDLDVGYARACTEHVAASEHLSACVTLAGATPHSQIGAHYRASNLALSASRMETYGIALQEARHYGIPILAVRGGNSEQHVSHGRTGELVDTPALLADALVDLVAEPTRHAAYLRGAAEARPADTAWADVATRLRKALDAGVDAT